MRPADYFAIVGLNTNGFVLARKIMHRELSRHFENIFVFANLLKVLRGMHKVRLPKIWEFYTPPPSVRLNTFLTIQGIRAYFFLSLSSPNLRWRFFTMAEAETPLKNVCSTRYIFLQIL